VVIGGSAGMGLATARLARAEGAEVILTARDPDRLQRVGVELGAREHLRTTLPIRRVVGPADVAALAVHLMVNTAVTGATFDMDGGQQLVEG
jgi:NAD(P)-dependent dehydrogenase (short-subunit alcohol dehydrogenase family)